MVPPEITSVSVEAMKPGGTNPRKRFEDAAMAELIESVRTHGVLQPVLLRPWPGPTSGRGITHELVAGERRWRAAKAARLDVIPALVRELTNEQVLEIQVIENLQRVDLHPLEEADGYRALIASKAGYDVARIAEKVGRSVAYVYDRLKLANLVDGARQLFLSGKIQPGHAIVLARLKPEDQSRAITTDDALFEDEQTLFDPDAYDEPESEDLPDVGPRPLERLKTRTVRELQAWIDQHVKFDAHDEDPVLFPDTVAAVSKAVEEEEKVVQITREYYVQPTARDGSKIIGPRSWKRAEPPCERQVTGVIVVGPGRGQAFPVCIDKKRCAVHWAKEIRDAKKRQASVEKEAAATGKKGADKWELQRQKEEEQRRREDAERERWRKAAPAILTAIAGAVKAAPAGSQGVLADLIVDSATGYDGMRARKATSFVSRGTTAEDLVRFTAFMLLSTHAASWSAVRDFPPLAKKLGFDVRAIVDASAPPAPAVEPKCATCGCTETKACKGGCSWHRKPDPKTGLGLCSACVTHAAPPKRAPKPAKKPKGRAA